MSSIRVTRTNTINDDNKEEYECIDQIFDDPENENSRRWIWRKNLEIARSDIRNSGFYANYVGSKGTRKHAANNHNSKPKPSHYLKHLVKIGCPQHDLKPIFENNLKFNVNPTICTHKSWKCGNINNNNNISNHNYFGTLIHELSMDEVGLEFKRSAYSVKPLLIQYGSSFITNIFCKRIANTNFNKIFRPGSYGNSPSLKKGSWKDGKVFYVFKNDKLVLNIDNFINIVFELESPKTIINDNKNKHYIIDGWQNVVGGVGFYSPSTNNKKKKTGKKSIETVLVFRKSMDFPKECLEKSKVKIYINNNNNNNADNRILNQTEKLIIGSKQLSLNVQPIPVLHQTSINNTSSSSSISYSSGSNSPLLLPSVSNSPSPLTIPPITIPDQQSVVPDYVHNGLSRSFDGDSVGQQSQSGSDMSIVCGGYGAYHGPSRSVTSYRYNPMQSHNEINNGQYASNEAYYEVQQKLQKDNYDLNQQNKYLSTKVQSLTSLNKQFMEENDRLLQEKIELEQRLAMLQNTLDQRQEQQHQQQLQLQESSQYPMSECMQLPQSQWMDNPNINNGHMIQMNMNENINRNLNDNTSKYHMADDYSMDYTMSNNINQLPSYDHNEMNYVDIMQHSSQDCNYSQNMISPFINNNSTIYTPNGHQYQ